MIMPPGTLTSELGASLRPDHPKEQPTFQPHARIRVYLMDLWSFVPYYSARLCASLREEGIDAKLGSVSYHLERNYFRSMGILPDMWLFDAGGSIRNALLRRIVKSMEYGLNLCLLAIRLFKSTPAILHVQYLPFLERGLPFEIWFLKWARYIGSRIVYTVHNLTRQDAPDQHKPVFRRAYVMADALICHGEFARAQLNREFGIPTNKIWVIPHGPLFEENPAVSQEQARAALGLPIGESLVLCLGVISEYKGVPFLLDAWRKLVDSGGKGRLLIAGTGDPRLLSSIREKVFAEELAGSVDLRLVFIPVEKLPLFYQAADVLVYPYKAGTTSGALLTGMNYGKAIIATSLPFFRQYLRDHENAVLVDYGDVGALADALRTLMNRPEERARLTRALKEQIVKAVSWQEIAKVTRICYEKILQLPLARTQRL
jgi:glycosyltransferase involved in cell wall biosynthesis